MKLGVPRETRSDERRVALVPESIVHLSGLSVNIQSGAGAGASYSDSDYKASGASISDTADGLYADSDIVLKVQPPSPSEAELVKEGSTLVSFLYPTSNLETVRALSRRRVTALAMELMPRISRAQQMDVLSSQSMVAGYKAVVIAADTLPKLFPLLMTAAGTVTPARVFVIGAGVAGLQAISVARRLGASVEAYDVRPAAKEQVQSLGAKFVEVPVASGDAQDAGGYAKAQSQDFYLKQQELLAATAVQADVVITTALVPGQKAPMLVSADAVKGMHPGSVIVDLAGEQGGNCALSEPGKTVVKHGVTIHAPINLPSSMAPEASRLYSRNITSFLLTMLKEGRLEADASDELVRGTMVLKQGEPVNQATKDALLLEGPK